jgi:hypothetical protein
MAFIALPNEGTSQWMHPVGNSPDADAHPALIEAVATHPVTKMEFEPVSFFARVAEIAAARYPDLPRPNTTRLKPQRKPPSKRRRMRL